MTASLMVTLAIVFVAMAAAAYVFVGYVVRGYQAAVGELFGESKTRLEAAYYFMTAPGVPRLVAAAAGVVGVIFGVALHLTLPVLGLLMVVCVAAGVVGYGQARKMWNARMEEQFLQALGLLTSSLRAGQNLSQAIETSTRYLPAPMSTEFSIMTRQLRLGMGIRTVLEEFAVRLPSEDARQATSAMTLAMGTGADLPRVFSDIDESIRARRSVERKIESLTALGRAQGLFLALLPVIVLALMALQPSGHVQMLFQTAPGNLALMVVALLQGISLFLVHRITRIEV